LLHFAQFKKTLTSCVLIAAAAGAVAQGVIPSSSATSSESPATITVDFANKVGPYKPMYSWFGYDEANYTTMRNGKVLLRELRDLSPVPVYIRAHHLLTSGDGKAELKFSSTNVYREDASGKPIYDFTLLDGIFDEYKAAGVRPMVEFGFMPKDLAAEVLGRNEYQVHYPKSTISGASNNPPKDYKKWGNLIHAVTAHLVERYGKYTVLQWYFEVWNEPDIDYWHATPEDYWKLYDYAVANVKAVLPTARVGGPATTSPSSEKAYNYLKGFLDHVQSGKSLADGKPIPLDFISFHAKGRPTIVDQHVTMGIKHELADADRGFYLISQYPKYRNLPIIISEADPEGCAACSSRVNPANNYRNGTLYPAYTATAYKALFELQDKHKVNLLSMLSWSFEFEDKDYFEGFRSLSTNGINKPVLNLFRMLGLMSGTRVLVTSSASVPLETLVSTGVRDKTDIDALATVDDRKAAVLLWNYHDADKPADAAPTTINLSGLPAATKRVLVQHYRIDDTHSNAYTVWKAMGSPQKPTTQQYAQLQSAAGLQLLTSPTWMDVADGKLTLTTELPRQSISLVKITW
jgi:xylan 1,4-beta-xylosidase